MGNYRITINAVGGHGQDRGKASGETVDFGAGTPEDIVRAALDALRGSGNSVQEATRRAHVPRNV